MKKQILISFIIVAFAAAQVLAQHAYDIYYTVGVQHHGLLWLNEDGTGVMRVKYYDGKRSRNVTIEQGMETTAISGVPALEGYDVVFAGTRTAHPSYAPDILFYKTDYYGNVMMYVTDAYGNLARVSLREVFGDEYRRLKRQFGW